MPNQSPRTSPPAAGYICIGSPRFDVAERQPGISADGLEGMWRSAFATHGMDAPASVTGDFAVGIRLEDGSVFLAVDRFAIRSLCYRIEGDDVRFAERADALATSASDLEPQAIFDYLYFHVIPSPQTIFRGVYRVPPGHCVLFRNGTLTVRPYWRPRFDQARASDFASLKAEFLQCLEHAVADQMVGNQTGCFLSGGTDSSTVAGMLAKLGGMRRPDTFSIGFEAEGYDEMEYSRIAARHFGTNLHEYYITPEDLIRSIPEVAASYDQPFGNSSVLPAYYCARLAKESGVERMLGGDGGDELFGGNTRYAKQRVFGLYDHVPAGFRNGLLEPLLASNSIAARIPGIRKASSYVQQASVPMPDRMHGYNLLTRLGIADVLTPAFVARVDRTIPLVHQRNVYSESAGTKSLVNRMLAYDWRYTLAETDLPKVVGATRLAGMPVGFPMLDQRLVDFSLRLPASYKVKGLKLRWFFKEALRGFLPDEIITKKKQGFGLPFGPWTSRHQGLFKLANDSLRSLADRGILRAEFVETLMQARLHEHPGYFGEMIWISMMLEQWLQAHAPDFRIS